ncbi:MAG TPA: hypothetical protein VFK05_30690 [Polyangiaceae bacterium]|nr:hypothetical protein [Polyangiaceae bacterium]
MELVSSQEKSRLPTQIVALLAAAIALCWVFAIDVVTNDYDIKRLPYDCLAYIDMAEHPVGHSAHPISPFAFRVLTPAIARGLNQLFDTETETGFSVVAHVGAWLQLLLVFGFARRGLGAERRTAAFVTLLCSLQYFNFKYYLFDVYRPDHLAQPLMIAAWWALLERRFNLALLACAVGLPDREFLLVPSVLLSGLLAQTAWRTKSSAAWARWALSTLALGVVFVLPRLLIHTEQSVTLESRFHGSWVSTLIGAPLQKRRLANLAYSLLAYTLPVWLLASRAGLRRLAALPKDRRYLALAHVGLVLVLSLYGGTDIPRFVAYLQPVLIMALVAELEEPARPPVLVATVLAMVVFNRAWSHIPVDDVMRFVDFYGGWDDRVRASARRGAEAIACIAAVWSVGYAATRVQGRRLASPVVNTDTR